MRSWSQAPWICLCGAHTLKHLWGSHSKTPAVWPSLIYLFRVPHLEAFPQKASPSAITLPFIQAFIHRPGNRLTSYHRTLTLVTCDGQLHCCPALFFLLSREGWSLGNGDFPLRFVTGCVLLWMDSNHRLLIDWWFWGAWCSQILPQSWQKDSGIVLARGLEGY